MAESMTEQSSSMRTIAARPHEASDSKLKTATNHFNKFYARYKPGTSKKLSDLEEADVDDDMLSHLVAHLEDSSKSFNTTRGYYSSIKCALEKSFPSHKDLLNLPKWHKDIKDTFVEICHEKGVPIENRHLRVEEADHHQLCKFMFENNMHEECSLQSLDFANGGRIAEGPKLEWKHLSLLKVVSEKEKRCCLVLNWLRGKTRTLTDTLNCVHKYDWLVCVFHCLARLLMLQSRPDDKIFPRLAQLKVSGHMNGIMKAAYANWQTVNKREEIIRKENEARGIYPVDVPFQMTENLTTHGNRAGCVTLCRMDGGVPDAAIKAHCGLAGSAGSSHGETIDTYTSVKWAAESKVSIDALFHKIFTITCEINHVGGKMHGWLHRSQPGWDCSHF